MSQSSVLVATLAAGFLLFIAARGRLPVYTAVLWGAAPKGGGGEIVDKDGDGLDKKDALEFGYDFAGKLLPYPFNIPFQFQGD